MSENRLLGTIKCENPKCGQTAYVRLSRPNRGKPRAYYDCQACRAYRRLSPEEQADYEAAAAATTKARRDDAPNPQMESANERPPPAGGAGERLPDPEPEPTPEPEPRSERRSWL